LTVTGHWESDEKARCAHASFDISFYCPVHERDSFMVQQMSLPPRPSTALAALLQREFVTKILVFIILLATVLL